MSVRGAMLTIAGSSWGEKDITPVEKKKKSCFTMDRPILRLNVSTSMTI
jgi:hypothetical protein